MNFADKTRGPLLRLFEFMKSQPLLVCIAILALQTLFLLDSRALWFSDEIRYADVFQSMVNDGKWLVLQLNGEFYPDKPPVFFWLLWGLQLLTGLAGEPLFFLGAAVSGGLFMASVIWLARQVQAGKGHRLATGLLLLTCFYVIGLTHYLRMDLLFAALIVAAEVCLFKAWQRSLANWWTAAGFLLMALAVLTKGPLGLALPLVGSVAYLAWVGRLRRLLRIDIWRGAMLLALLLLAWAVGAYLVEGRAYLENIFEQQIYKRAVNTWHHEQPFWHYLVTFPAAFLPWTLLLLALPWKKLPGRDLWRDVFTTRREPESEENGLAYCWCLLLSGFVLLSAVSSKIVVYLLPLFAPLAVIAAHALLELEGRRSRRVFLPMAVILGLLAAVLPFANHFHPWPVRIEGLGLAGGTLLLVAVLLGRFVPLDAPRAALTYLVLALTLWLQPVGMFVVPSLDAIMSPKAQAELMGSYIDAGYTPLGYKLYSGTYTYYAGHDIRELDEMQDLERELALHPDVVLGMRRKYWDRWENRPVELRLVHEQWIADRPYVLAVKGPLLEGEGGEDIPEVEVNPEPDAEEAAADAKTGKASPDEGPQEAAPGADEAGGADGGKQASAEDAEAAAGGQEDATAAAEDAGTEEPAPATGSAE